MLPYFKRFNMPAVAAMVSTICILALMNLSLVSTGYTNSRGMPFKWYKWSDFGGKDIYNWWAIPGNIIVALAVAVAVGMLVERLTPKRA